MTDLARVYLHNPFWPRQRIAELLTAFHTDRAHVLMDQGTAVFNISRGEPRLADSLLQQGALVCIESHGLPPWAGYVSTLREQDADAGIEVVCVDMIAGLSAHPTAQGEHYDQPTGSGAVALNLLRHANALADTGIYAPVAIEPGTAVDDLDLGGQSTLDALNELADRSGYEWSVEVTSSPRRLEGAFRWTFAVGDDLSSRIVLRQGVHFAALEYELDLQRQQEAVTAFGGAGAISDRPAVTVAGSVGPQRRGLGSAIEQAEVIYESIGDLPPGLRTERTLHLPGTTSQTELSRQARQALEKPLGGGERFAVIVNRLVDWSLLLPGNFVRIVARLSLGPIDRRVRILGFQPDEETGQAELVVEVATS